MIEELGPLPSELRESSGLAVSRTQPGVLWSHNDSGDAPTLYAIDLKGRLLARVAVTDAIARDWEDIAMGTCPWEEPSGRQCLYVADTGNNDRSRDVLTVFVVLEPTIAGADPAQSAPRPGTRVPFPLSRRARRCRGHRRAAQWRRDDRHQGPHADDLLLRRVEGRCGKSRDVGRGPDGRESGRHWNRARSRTRAMGHGGSDVPGRGHARRQNLQRDLLLCCGEARRLGHPRGTVGGT